MRTNSAFYQSGRRPRNAHKFLDCSFGGGDSQGNHLLFLAEEIEFSTRVCLDGRGKCSLNRNRCDCGGFDWERADYVSRRIYRVATLFPACQAGDRGRELSMVEKIFCGRLGCGNVICSGRELLPVWHLVTLC